MISGVDTCCSVKFIIVLPVLFSIFLLAIQYLIKLIGCLNLLPSHVTLPSLSIILCVPLETCTKRLDSKFNL